MHTFQRPVLTVVTRKSSLLSIILLVVFSLSILCSVQRSKLLISEDHRVMTHPPVGGLPINSISNSSKWELCLLYPFYILVKLCQHGLLECILNFGPWASIILIILLLKYLTIGSYYSVICYIYISFNTSPCGIWFVVLYFKYFFLFLIETWMDDR